MLVSLAHVESSLTDLIEVTPKIDHNNFLFIISIFKANIMIMVMFYPKFELPCCINYDLGKTIQFLLAPKLLVMVIQNFLH